MIDLSLLLGLVLTTGAVLSEQHREFPPIEQLPVVKELPDPFIFTNGTRVQTKTDWQHRRQEIALLISALRLRLCACGGRQCHRGGTGVHA